MHACCSGTRWLTWLYHLSAAASSNLHRPQPRATAGDVYWIHCPLCRLPKPKDRRGRETVPDGVAESVRLRLQSCRPKQRSSASWWVSAGGNELSRSGPLNRTDPQCWQATYTNLSFYLANTNYTYPNGTVNASLEDTGAHGWLEGPPMLNGTWNDVSVVWRPNAANLDTGTLSMSVDNPLIGPEQTTSHVIKNASNILPPYGTPFFFGTSRFPNLAPCHPFFGKLRDLRVWNGVDCKSTSK